MAVPKDPKAYEAFRRKVSIAHLGLRASDETKRKMSEAHRGKPGHLAWNRGKRNVYSLEYRKKISDGLRGKPGGMLGKHHSLEVRRRMSAAKKGRRFSEAFKRRMSEIRRGFTGPKSGNWKGGITPLVLLIRHCFEYRQWRSDIFTRDEFTCVLCGKRGGGTLHADHFPKTFTAIFHENGIKTIEDALRCQEFWNINNGRTLCEKCHREHHAIKQLKQKVVLPKAA
jgi:hypothetical protein